MTGKVLLHTLELGEQPIARYLHVDHGVEAWTQGSQPERHPLQVPPGKRLVCLVSYACCWLHKIFVRWI